MSLDALDLNDPEWTQLRGGYRVPYDPRTALGMLERGESVEIAWKELWTELYHQGDIGEAAYAAVPHLVRIHETRGIPDWNTYALVAMIDDARRHERNPELPAKLQGPYEAAWRRLVQLGLVELDGADDSEVVSSIIAVLAMGKGQFNLGRFAALFDDDERQEILAETGWREPAD